MLPTEAITKHVITLASKRRLIIISLDSEPPRAGLVAIWQSIRDRSGLRLSWHPGILPAVREQNSTYSSRSLRDLVPCAIARRKETMTLTKAILPLLLTWAARRPSERHRPRIHRRAQAEVDLLARLALRAQAETAVRRQLLPTKTGTPRAVRSSTTSTC